MNTCKSRCARRVDKNLTAKHEAQHSTFLSPAHGAHVFVINDKDILDSLIALGARPRLFGNRPMMPGVNNLKASYLSTTDSVSR